VWKALVGGARFLGRGTTSPCNKWIKITHLLRHFPALQIEFGKLLEFWVVANHPSTLVVLVHFVQLLSSRKATQHEQELIIPFRRGHPMN